MPTDHKAAKWLLFPVATVLAAFLIALLIRPISGQTVTCEEVIADLEQTLSVCRVMDNNTACYGHELAEALPIGEPFEVTGDQIPLAAAERIATLTDLGTVVMYMSVGAFDPVKMITFGNAQIESDSEAPAPNSFVVRSVGGSELCEQTPPGLIVFTEPGQSGVMSINGTNLTLGSSTYLTFDGEESMNVVNLGGQVDVSAGGSTRTIPAGNAILIQGVQSTPELIGTPIPSELARSEVARWLVDDPRGLRSIRNLNDSILSCTRNNVLLPYAETLRIYSPGQECPVSFCVSAGERITVRMEAVDDELDPWIDLRGTDRRRMLHNDNADQSDPNALLCNETMPVAGCYTIVAHSRNHETTGAFNLSIVAGSEAAKCEPPTATPTWTPSPTITNTPTPTDTNTPTKTFTPTPTKTDTPTPTDTDTPEPPPTVPTKQSPFG